MSIFKRDIKKDVWQWGLLGGLGQGIYIMLVATFFQVMEKYSSVVGRPIFGALVMLTLLVFSATVSGLLVLGRPLILAMRKDYKEAGLTLAVSLGGLFVIMAIVLLLALM